jgi:hypothetical protein
MRQMSALKCKLANMDRTEAYLSFEQALLFSN